MAHLEKSYIINASLEKVWKALTDPKEIEGWGAGPAKMEEEIGSQFKLWGGDIHGTNTQVEKPSNGRAKLLQDWYGGDWREPSKVTISLSAEEQATKIDLTHENLPDAQAEDFSQGWDDYYFGEMKKYLEG